MRIVAGTGKRFAVKLASAVMCVVMFVGSVGMTAFAGRAEAVAADAPYRLVDIYCSQGAKDALGDEQLETLVNLIVTSIEPQAVNLLIDRFPCFREAAENDGLGREIGLYIYYETGEQDGIEEHENVAPGAYAYVGGYPVYEEGAGVYRYMFCMDAQSLTTTDDANRVVLDMDGAARIQVDTTFCHELFHAFMDDYNRVGMSGYTDFVSYICAPDELITSEEGEALIEATVFPCWFMEGLAGCVGNIYPADLAYFREYRHDLDANRYLDACTGEQLCRMYANTGFVEGTGDDRYDLEAATEDNTDGHVNGSIYVSGYLACLYLADLACRQAEGDGAVRFDRNGDVEAISSEKLREGLSDILRRLHQGDTFDEVIRDVSGGAYDSTADFTRRFIKGTYDQAAQDYAGDPESLAFCVGFINYMNRLDALDPDTHPAGSLLMDDFASTLPTPIEKDIPADSEFYRFVERNTMTASTVPNEGAKDGGTSYSGRDSFEAVVEQFKANGNP